MTREYTIREIQEAQDAGQSALLSLRNAQRLLDSAGNWGLLDLFGGDFLSGLMKHSKINEANRQMEQARYEVQRFQKELRDVYVLGNFGVEVGDFLTFADFFFDGFLADFMVQSKIGEAKRQVNDMSSWLYTWLPLIFLFLILYHQKEKRRKMTMAKFRKRKREKKIMQELAKRFIGKDCYINLMDGNADGVIIEVTDGGIVLEKDGKQQAVNLEYVVKIQEYPYNKKGKRSSFIG